MKLKEIKQINAKLTVKTGLHIGGSNDSMQIGGVDNAVIRHPITREPYIPGSSIKGKIRSLLEQSTGLMKDTKGAVLSPKNAGNDTFAKGIIKVFGSSAADSGDENEVWLARAAFSDSNLDQDWKNSAIANGWNFTEIKTENSIDRIKGTAANPRQTERVPAGATFDFAITFKIFEDGDEALLENILFRGLKLLSLDALGGSVSRGYGRIELSFEDKTYQEMFEKAKAFV